MDIKTNEIGDLLRSQIKNINESVDVNEVGEVLEIGDGVARTSGLGSVMSSELVEFPNNVFGMALNLEEENVGAVLFGDSSLVKEGDTVKRTGKVVEVPVGKELLGRVVDPLGQPMDGKGPINAKETLPIERKALGVMQRFPVKEPLQTGLKSIDSMIPIGRGQRELIIGDLLLFRLFFDANCSMKRKSYIVFMLLLVKRHQQLLSLLPSLKPTVQWSIQL